MQSSHFGQALSSTKSPREKTLAGYLKKNSNMVAHREPRSRSCLPARLVRHAIHDVIEPHAKSHGSEIFRISRIVRPFPGVAQVHVVADGDHHAAFVVANGPPLWHIAVLFVGPSGIHILFARDLEARADVVEPVENFIVVAEV